jgi:hydantoinase/carbamoylase family amidase
MQINIDRLISDIERYATYGKGPGNGVTRPSFSEADIELRSIFIQELTEMGLEVVVDGAANIWGRWKGTGKKAGSIVIGSHLDTVPNGGKYDGALGVLMAKEVMKSLKENGAVLDHDLEIVSFSAEESNDFNLSTFGSRAFAGLLPADGLQEIRDSNGVRLADALAKAGGGLDRFEEMYRMHDDKKAFLELHIEQGQRLESRNISVAAVDRAVGIHRSKVTVVGQANHSGTTVMDFRVDALAAASEMILEVEQVCKRHASDLVGTVGKLNVIPNAVNIIPGQIDLVLEIRDGEQEQIDHVVQEIRDRWDTIARRRGIGLFFEFMLDDKPAILNAELVSILQSTADEIAEPYLTLASMAVHDAVHIAKITKSVMVFVKSIGGKSHCPEEYSTPEDIRKVGNWILRGIVHIDRDLSSNTNRFAEVTQTE